MNSQKYKVVKKSKNKIKCLRDEESGIEVFPSDINCSDKLNDNNIALLASCLDGQLDSDQKVNLFDFLNDINEHKKMLVDDPKLLKAFPEWMVLRILSFSNECIFYANEVNVRPYMSKYGKYKYLTRTIRKKRRFIKVHKPEKKMELDALRYLCGIGEREAKLYYDIVVSEYGSFPQEILDLHETLKNRKGLIEK